MINRLTSRSGSGNRFGRRKKFYLTPTPTLTPTQTITLIFS